MNTHNTADLQYEYIVVGSGAGGGTVAARLAEKGRRVLLLEAGGDPSQLAGGALQGDQSRLPWDYDVPAFHIFASENAAMSWNFFVRHYADQAKQRRDPKYCEQWNGRPVDGVLYPRAGTLGGCTAHNAMILVYPHGADWDFIAETMGDPSWQAVRMRCYFEALENCHHRPVLRLLAKLGWNPAQHGWKGWLRTEKAFPLSVLHDHALVNIVLEAAREAAKDIGISWSRLKHAVEGKLDPNDWRVDNANDLGVRYVPLTTRNHVRVGTRERLLEVAARYPDRLKIQLNALVTRVLFDDTNRATGVEYMLGPQLYRASSHPAEAEAQVCHASASREVILCGGAFNTPQLLMLSGIGPAQELARHGIPLRVDLPGVGRNLQDRYEVSVVSRIAEPAWQVFQGAKFAPGDPLFKAWSERRDGPYTTNGSILTAFTRSAPDRALPDLFFLALLGRFEGYFPAYSAHYAHNLNYLTWTVLKAHTHNCAGQVTLRSADPRDTPLIDFRYFEDGNDPSGEDLDSVVSGVRLVRRITAKLQHRKLIGEEVAPGEQIESDDDLRQFIRNNAWGHHASSTCAIGRREQGGVLTSDFRVYGTQGLRVVDASVFPRIPGFFIVSAVYMVGEKAADVILASDS